MAANDYSRTVSITPVGTAYSWDTPPSWITITQVGTTDEWTITVAANTGSARSAVLTVRHDNGTTTDTINVTQAGVTVPPTATPVPPTPTATSVPPTPTPTSDAGAGETLTLTNNGSIDSPIEFGFGGVYSATVGWAITSSGSVSLSNVPSWLSGSVANLASNSGNITLTQMTSPVNGESAVITVTSSNGPVGYIWVSIGGGRITLTATPTPSPTSSSGAGPTPTPTSSSGAGPTPTPTTFRLVTPTPTSSSGAGCYRYQILNEGIRACSGTLTGITDCNTGYDVVINIPSGSASTICTSSSIAAIEVALSSLANGLTCTVSALGTSC